MDNLEGFLERLVRDEISKYDLKDKITGYLVKKKRRGTFQAFEESGVTEKEVTDTTVEYIKEWLLNEMMDGGIRKVIEKEIKNQAIMELSVRGFLGIIDR